MAISNTLVFLHLRQQLTLSSLLLWAALRSRVSRFFPALLSVFYRIPALAYTLDSDTDTNDTRERDPEEEENGHKIDCEILYSPPDDAWELDIIFIHGLHGSKCKTWRQGDWNTKYPAVQKKAFRRHSSMISKHSSQENACKAKKLFKSKTFRSMSTPDSFDSMDKKKETDAEDFNSETFDEDILSFKAHSTAIYEYENIFGCENDVNVENDSEMFTRINSLPSQTTKRKNANEIICDGKFYPPCDVSCKTNNKNAISTTNCDNSLTLENKMKRKLEINTNRVYDSCEIKIKKVNDSTGTQNTWTFTQSSLIERKEEMVETKFSINSEYDTLCSEYEDVASASLSKESNESEEDEIYIPIEKDQHIFYPETATESLSSCWPRDWIPQDYPGARVICISYSTDPYLWRPVWIKPYYRSSLEKRSKEMVEKLIDLKTSTKPIVWVGHSKGGLFIKEIFSKGFEDYSNGNLDSKNSKIYQMSKAMIFYSVPHRGSHLANLNIPPLFKTSSELHEIQYESEFVLKLHEKFLKAMNESKYPPSVQSYMETRRTLMGAFYLRIVSLLSGDPGIGNMYGVSLDHREICKPTSRSCFLYQELLEFIKQIFDT